MSPERVANVVSMESMAAAEGVADTANLSGLNTAYNNMYGRKVGRREGGKQVGVGNGGGLFVYTEVETATLLYLVPIICTWLGNNLGK